MEEPAFLRRMRAAASGAGHQERYIAPRNRKTRVDDEEDEPQYVLEDGSIMTKAEFESMEKGEDPDDSTTEAAGNADKQDAKSGTEGAGKQSASGDSSSRVVEAGAKKKRKAVKVVGGDADEDDQPAPKKGKPQEEPGKPKKAGGKPKRKVKLSFDQEE